ncbi:DUF397 domain-containing protein [Streptomyces sp. NPDC003007]
MDLRHAAARRRPRSDRRPRTAPAGQPPNRPAGRPRRDQPAHAVPAPSATPCGSARPASGDQGGDCVEVAEASAAIALRDSKTPAGPILTLDPATFTTFVNWTATTAE